ncbi:hypothetical protein NDA12_002991 [Ustilago hordei]|nr:hypothetical protein NDA12_002991 [Ustilago hordei]KAJ1593528.1 hypothetical protein NDA15_004869 [Ustilago hordei]
MNPSLTILLLTLFATLAVAAPVAPGFGEKALESTSESLSNHLSDLTLSHPLPPTSQARRPMLTFRRPSPLPEHGAPTLDIPGRPGFETDSNSAPWFNRFGGAIRTSKKHAARDQAEPYSGSFKERVQNALARKKAAMQEQEPVTLARQASRKQAQWEDMVLEEHHLQPLGGSGSGRRASSSTAGADSTMDYSRFSDQGDTASSRSRN